MEPLKPPYKRNHLDFLEFHCQQPRNLGIKRVRLLPLEDRTHGDLLVVQGANLYGFVDSVEEAQTAVKVGRQHRWNPVAPQDLVNRDTFYHVTFDCVEAAWIHGLPHDYTEWPALDTIAQKASSCLVEVTLSKEEYELIDQRLSPVDGDLLPPLVEGTWWGLVIRRPGQLDPQVPSLPAIVRLPQRDSGNPVTILWAEEERPAALIDLVVPRELEKLLCISHGWVEQSGYDPDLPPYVGF